MTFTTLQLFSFGLGAFAYLTLTAFCVVTWIRRITGKAAFLASASTLAFILILALLGESPLATTFEMIALYSWILLLLRAIGLGYDNFRAAEMRPVAMLFSIASLLAVAACLYTWTLPPIAFTSQNSALSPLLAMELLLSVCGLVAVEQLVRNAREDLIWRVRYLNIGLGIVFTYSVLHGAFGLLYNMHLPILTVMQPTVLALAAPFVAIASLRNRDQQLRFNVSRQFVFKSGVLIATGCSLLLIGIAGYYVRLFGGDVATALAVFIGTAVAAGVLVITGSSTFQGRLKRFITENLYERKHDYRHEWARVSRQLTEPNPDFSLPQQAIRAFLGILGSPGGAIWRLSEGDILVPEAQLHAAGQEPFTHETSDLLQRFFAEQEWIIDLDAPPTELDGRVVAELQSSYPDQRFLIPLRVEQGLYGVVGVLRPDHDLRLNWEDYDILKLVSRQAAGFLALEHAGGVLSDAQRLNTFNRLSAFVVHDVKTISAQLSLLLENAQRHKNNPAFIDDMLDTVGNSVSRMQKLLKQFQEEQSVANHRLELGELTAKAVRRFELRAPRPSLCCGSEPVEVVANEEKLAAVIGHTLDNAIEATSETGAVTVNIVRNDHWAELYIEDDGTGMDDEFIAKTLFQPFESTKGLTGMGIGAYQTREYIRSIGGDVQVSSQPGEGTRFTLRIPLAVTG